MCAMFKQWSVNLSPNDGVCLKVQGFVSCYNTGLCNPAPAGRRDPGAWARTELPYIDTKKHKNNAAAVFVASKHWDRAGSHSGRRTWRRTWRRTGRQTGEALITYLSARLLRVAIILWTWYLTSFQVRCFRSGSSAIARRQAV